MKKVTILFLSIFILNLVSAIPEITFQNEKFQPQETILAQISGEFAKEISDSDIKFFEGRKQISFEHEVSFYNDTYYLYIYINREGNFTLKIEDILYKEQRKLSSMQSHGPSHNHKEYYPNQIKLPFS